MQSAFEFIYVITFLQLWFSWKAASLLDVDPKFAAQATGRVDFGGESGSHSEVLGWGLTFDGLTPSDTFSSTSSSEEGVTETGLITQPTTTQPTTTQLTITQLITTQPSTTLLTTMPQYSVTQPPITQLSIAMVSCSSGSSAPTDHSPTVLDKYWSPTVLSRSIGGFSVGTSSNMMVPSGVFRPKSGNSDNSGSFIHTMTGSMAPVRAANASWTFSKSGRTLAPKTTSHTETRTIRESHLSSVLIVEATKSGEVSAQTQAQALAPTSSLPTAGLGVESTRPTAFTGAAQTVQRQIPLFSAILCFIVFWGLVY